MTRGQINLRHSRRTTLALGTVLALAAIVGAATAQAAPLSLSQEQAVKRTLERHPAIEAAARAIDVADARTSETVAAWLPRFKAEASYMYVGPLQSLVIDTGLQLPGSPAPITIEKDMGSVHNAYVGASFAWRALDFGSRLSRTAAADALGRAERAQGELQKAEIAYAVRAAYLGARFFQEMEAVSARSLAVAEGELADRQAERKAGLGSDLDVSRVQMRVAELRGQSTRASQERARLLGTLRLLLGLGPEVEINLSDDLRTLGSSPLPTAGSSEQNPAKQRIAALGEASDLESDRLFWDYWPTIDVVGSVKYQYPKNYFENDSAGVVYSVGAVWSWTIFDGDLIRRQRAEAEAKTAQLHAQGQALDEDIVRKRLDAEAQARTAEAAVTSAQGILDSARVYERAARASLAAGSGTELERRQATDSAAQAELGVLKALLDAAMARASLLLALGRAEATSEVAP